MRGSPLFAEARELPSFGLDKAVDQPAPLLPSPLPEHLQPPFLDKSVPPRRGGLGRSEPSPMRHRRSHRRDSGRLRCVPDRRRLRNRLHTRRTGQDYSIAAELLAEVRRRGGLPPALWACRGDKNKPGRDWNSRHRPKEIAELEPNIPR